MMDSDQLDEVDRRLLRALQEDADQSQAALAEKVGASAASVWRRVKDEPGVTDMRPMDHGNAWSLYFRDPEGNRLEVFCDTQWYIEQPCLEDLDLSLPADQIRAKSDAFCRNAPGFRPIAEYQAEIAAKMGLKKS